MRLLQLSLLRYGSFTGAVLDFGAAPQGLHVIYGPNEAGKSTALRALSAFFYGIAQRSPDAHLHDYSQLLLGADLEVSGQLQHWLRKKGRKNTLTTAAGEAVGEAKMRAALCGVSQDSFESAFALDGARLREGGQSLAEGSGETGQVLFDASSGGPAVERVLAALRTEADELFKPGRATKPLLNVMLAKHAECKVAVKLRVTDPGRYAEQELALSNKRKQKREHDERLRQLRAEHGRLSRAKAVLPTLQHREACLGRLQQLSAYEHLAPDLQSRRQRAEGELRELEAEVRSLTEVQLRAQQRLAALGPSEALLSVLKTELGKLEDMIGRERKALQDLPKRRESLAVKTQEVDAVLARLGMQSVADAARFVVSPQLSQRIHQLATKRPPDTDDAEVELVEAEARAEECAAFVRSSGVPEDVSKLERRLERARRHGDLDERLASLKAQIQSQQRQLDRRLAALSPWSGSAEALATLSLPQLGFLESLQLRERDADAAALRLLDREREQRAAREEAEAQLQALVQGQGVPSEAELESERRERARMFADLRPALRSTKTRAEAQVQQYEQKVASADLVADRLRREAERVERRAQCEAEVQRRERELARVQEQRLTLEAERLALSADLAGQFAPMQFEPESLVAAQGWLTQAHGAAEALRAVEELEAEYARLSAFRARELEALGECLSEDLRELPLLEAVDRAVARVDDARSRSAAHAKSVLTRDAAAAQSAAAQRRLALAQRRAADWSADWTEAVAPLGLGASPAPELVLSMLREAQHLSGLDAARKDLEGRIAGILRDSAELKDAVDQLCADVGASPEGVAPIALAERIAEDAHAARSREQQRQALRRELSDGQEALDRVTALRDHAKREIDALLREAGAGTREELLEAEEGAAERAAVQGELRNCEAALRQAGEGAALETLLSETAGLDLVLVRSRLSEIDEELEALAEEREGLAVDIKGLTDALSLLSTDAGALAADTAWASASAAREVAERWVRLKLAALVLSREIERFREDSQGPLLARSTELFSQLTEGRYQGLRSELGDDDRYLLRAFRGDGRSLHIQELSEGTRDQLYLALRLAGYERHLQEGTELPLVLDDVLASFDDERGRAALAVLAQVAMRGQVLLFTHHESVVREAELLDGLQVRVHRLQKPMSTGDLQRLPRAQA
jgi:uncharacterized protein YhaN